LLLLLLVQIAPRLVLAAAAGRGVVVAHSDAAFHARLPVVGQALLLVALRVLPQESLNLGLAQLTRSSFLLLATAEQRRLH